MALGSNPEDRPEVSATMMLSLVAGLSSRASFLFGLLQRDRAAQVLRFLPQ